MDKLILYLYLDYKNKRFRFIPTKAVATYNLNQYSENDFGYKFYEFVLKYRL